MKKITYIILLCILSSIVKSQPYGETKYPHANSFLSSGTRTGLLGAGFLMAGYQITNAPLTANFYIDRTGPGGGFSGGSQFSNEYQIQNGSPGCTGGISQVLNCTGVSVVETQGMGGLAYALTGAFDRGCFFATLDKPGSVIGNVFFEFPINSTRPTKPLIIQAAAAGGGAFTNYYLCGTYLENSRRYTYIIKINENSTVLWSKIYDLGAGTSINARAIVESPFTSDLAIVGSAYRSANAVGSKGFFMLVNTSTGAVTSFEMIGQSTSLVQNDTLSSIAIASSPAPGSAGFIVGGYLDTIPLGGVPLVGKAWFMKLQPNGAVIWNSVFGTSLDLSAGMVMGVIERQATNSLYQYYGAVFSPSIGIIVMKLDASGNPYTNTVTPLANFNTFVYNGSGVRSSPNSISFEPNNLATNDLGIHVYGTYDVVSGGDHYFVEAYFNGAEPCLPTRNNLGTVSPGSNVFFYPTVSANNGLSPCFNFSIAQSPVLVATTILCTTISLPSGSNARQALATSLPEQINASGLSEIFPNPSNESVVIKYSISDEQPISFVLYDLLGNLIKQISPFPQTIGNHQVELNFKNLGLETGVYILHSSINGSDAKQKIIYRKE